MIDGTMMTIDGTVIPVFLHTLCLHSDTPQALLLARMIREELDRAGVNVVAASDVDS